MVESSLMRSPWLITVTLLACAGSNGPSDGDTGDTGGETGGEEPEIAIVTHSFGDLSLDAFEETQPCVSWTIDNEAPLYVNAVTLANGGSWHHSNWLVVPEEIFPGEDGYWNCGDRNFSELVAAATGTVLYAQSTQSWLEEQRLNPGAVIKIPPHHKIVASTHALNLAPRPVDTELRLSLEIIHPRDVQTVLAPLRLNYADLQIQPLTKSRFTSSCNLADRYAQTGGELDIKIHYVLPHYHYLGDLFELRIDGGPRDGELIYELGGFNADANGQLFPTPVDLTGAQGVTFTCGYDNWRDVEVGFGIGDQEMCVMLGLVETKIAFDGNAASSMLTEATPDAVYYESACDVIGIAKNGNQGPPTRAEREGELYVPPGDPGDAGLPPVAECVDVPATATPSIEVTLSSIRDQVFVPACTFSSCHGSGEAAGLDLLAADLHAELTNHTLFTDTALPLVDPGNADGSWLYKVLSECDPTTEGGELRNHMPRNAPVLLDPGVVSAVRDWIDAGAPND
jgi:hypothetical protein